MRTALLAALLSVAAAALDTSVDFAVVRSDQAPSDPAFDRVNTISFRTASWDPPMYHPSELALTTVWVQGGRIVDADLEINAVDDRFRWAILSDDPAVAALSPELDLQNAITHELGHVLGLDHPCYLVDPPDPPELDDEGAPVPSCSQPDLPASVLAATMYPSSTGGNIDERTLSDDEARALMDIYPAGRAPLVEGQPPSGQGGCAFAGSGRASGFGAQGALAVAALALARRRRRT